MLTRKALSRRTVLRGVGATIALPFLDAMTPALTAQAVQAVRRWVTFYAPNGMAMPYWTPAAVGSDFDLPRTLAPLEVCRDRMLVISGLADQSAFSRPGEGGGDHARAAGTFLTAIHVKKTPGAPQAGVSADQIAAATLGRDTAIASLELGVDSGQLAGNCDSGYNCSYISTVAWASATTPLLPEHDPRALFDRLFGDVAATPAERSERIRRDRSILDAVTEKIGRLNRNIGKMDRRKLDEYLESVRDVERRLQRTERENLPVPDRPASIPTTYAEHARLLMELLALAFEADLTRVATFMLARETSDRAYPEIGVADSHHPLSHHQGNADKIDRLGIINRFHVEQLAWFVNRLASVDDAAGQLLDNSILLYAAGISDSNSHSHVNLPVLLIGGRAMDVKGGAHVRVAARTSVANLHLSILDRLGVHRDQFGDSSGSLDLSTA
jgi:hypothetical protein